MLRRTNWRASLQEHKPAELSASRIELSIFKTASGQLDMAVVICLIPRVLRHDQCTNEHHFQTPTVALTRVYSPPPREGPMPVIFSCPYLLSPCRFLP